MYVLTIPATSAKVERQFSTAKLVMADHRAGRLNQDTQALWVYLKQNLETSETVLHRQIAEKLETLFRAED
jgi:hypothetical protein